MSRRSRVESIRREQILEAAYRAIARLGLSGTKMRHIAQEASVSQGILHYYFDTKYQLLSELLDWLTAAFAERRALSSGQSIPTPMEATAWDKLRAMIDFQCQLAGENRAMVEVFYDFWVQGTKDPHIGQAVQKEFSVYRQHVRQIVEEGVRNGEFAPESVELVPPLFVSLLEGGILQLIIDPQVFDPVAFWRKTEEILSTALKRPLTSDILPEKLVSSEPSLNLTPLT